LNERYASRFTRHVLSITAKGVFATNFWGAHLQSIAKWEALGCVAAPRIHPKEARLAKFYTNFAIKS